jgi:hypothetical protein
MGNPTPSQVRVVDPYASYHSNVVNKLTRMITTGLNCLFGTHSIEVTQASLTEVDCSEGQCFKDDVLIQTTATLTVDFEDSDFYVDPSGGWWNEIGYYYVVLDYVYVQSRPAPEADIKILLPSQTATLFTTDRYLFLKAVEVSWSGSAFEIDAVWDYDPGTPANRRVYAPLFAGVQDTIPPFDQDEHEARIIYVRSTDRLYWGTSARWETFNAIRDNVDTTGLTVGELAYIDATGAMVPAIADSFDHQADAVILQVGLEADGSGKVRMAGRADDVPVETGAVVAIGDTLYLSDSEAGTVTNVLPAAFRQSVGTAISAATGPSTISMWFFPQNMFFVAGASIIRESITAPGDWTLSAGDYYYDINIASLGGLQVTSAFFDGVDKIYPLNEELITAPPYRLRVWMPVNTVDLDAVVVG